METLHDIWNTLKKSLNDRIPRVYCKIRQVWWCSIGMNIGREIYGKNDMFERPVLVMKIYDREMVLVAPLTSKEHASDKYAFPILIHGTLAYALFSQVRTVSIKRFSQKIERLSPETFSEILEKYTELLNS